jgi:nitric oxide dioxygenase
MHSDIARIRSSWAKAVAGREILGDIFYGNLFEIAPQTRPMFPPSLDDQGRKLVQTLSWIVDHLEQEETLVATASALAVRHVDFGVNADHYAVVGEALIATLKAGLGDDFSGADEEAWTRVYGQLSTKMIEAAYPNQAA